MDDPLVKAWGARVGWLWHTHLRLSSSEVRFDHTNHHLRRPLPHLPLDLRERVGGRPVCFRVVLTVGGVLVFLPGVELHDAPIVRVLVGVLLTPALVPLPLQELLGLLLRAPLGPCSSTAP